MEKDLEKFFKKANSVSLTESEKSQMRGSIISYMEKYSSRAEAFDHVPKRSPYWKQFGVAFFSWRYVAAAVVVFVLTGGGVSVAASGSLPGDLLYPVKVNFNEEVRGTLIFSEEAKISWEESRAERRLEEAQSLVMSGAMTPRAKEQITDNFNKHVEQFTSRIKGFEGRSVGAVVELSSRFEATLSAHEEILDNLASISKENVESVNSITVAVRTKTENITRIKEEAQNSLSVSSITPIKREGVEAEEETFTLSLDEKPDKEIQEKRKEAAERMKKSASSKISELSSMAGRLKKNEIIGEEKFTAINEKLAEAKALIGEGEEFFESESYGEAFLVFRDSFNLAHRASLFLRAETALKVEIKETPEDGDVEIEETDILNIDPDELNGVEFDHEDKQGSVEKIRNTAESRLEKVEEVFSQRVYRPREITIEAESGISAARSVMARGTEIAEENPEEAFDFFKKAVGILAEVSNILDPENVAKAVEKEKIESLEEENSDNEEDTKETNMETSRAPADKSVSAQA